MNRKTGIHTAIIVAACLIVYMNTMQVPFQLDDLYNIAENHVITDFRHFLNLPQAFTETFVTPALQYSLRTRTVGFLTFALNYQLSGLDVRGFHIFNLAIHITNSILVYLLITTTLRTPFFTRREDLMPPALRPDGSNNFALACSLIFACHPLQTQAVTYIVQRFASLAALFYLLALVLFSMSSLVKSRGMRYLSVTVSIMAVMVGVVTKELTFTFPFILMVYYKMFFEGDWKKTVRAAAPYMMAILVLPLRLLLVSGIGSVNSTLFVMTGTPGITWHDYVVTQLPVMMTYLRLLLFPANQNLDYDFPVYRSLLQLPPLLSLVVVIAICGICASLYRKSTAPDHPFRSESRLVSFGILWFIITSIPESCLFPIADVIFEHRMYLPSVGFIIAVGGLAAIAQRKYLPATAGATGTFRVVVCSVIVILSVASIARNRVWSSKTSLWEDVVAKSPMKARPHESLGEAYQDQGRFPEAEKEFLMAIKLRPDGYESHFALGSLYGEMGRVDEGIKELSIALLYGVNSSKAHNNLANCYSLKGMVMDAIREYRLALQYDPLNKQASDNLRDLLARTGGGV